MLEEAARVDAAEEAALGRGRRGDELPAALRQRESRLATIRAAKAALEHEAREQAARAKVEAEARAAAREQRRGRRKGPRVRVPDPAAARPASNAQRNFTDPDSRIMKDGATQAFVQGYNAQAAVDGKAQIIVACTLTAAASDVEHFVPLLTGVVAYTGARPAIITADAGYFSEANLRAAAAAAVDVYIPPDREYHGVRAGAGPAALCRRGWVFAAFRRACAAPRAIGRLGYLGADRRDGAPVEVFADFTQAGPCRLVAQGSFDPRLVEHSGLDSERRPNGVLVRQISAEHGRVVGGGNPDGEITLDTADPQAVLT